MNLKTHLTSAIAALVLTSSFSWSKQAKPRPDVLVADFEADTYGDWKVEGEAFGPGPAKGKRLVNTFFKRDGTVGTPDFTTD